MTPSRLITGIVFMIIGLVLIGFAFISAYTLIYGIPLLIVGIVILLNKNEDKIEKRKDLKEKKYNK